MIVKYNRWTIEEEILLKKLITEDKLKYKQISYILKKSKYSVRIKAIKLGLTNSSKFWDKEQIEKLRILIEELGYTTHEAALELGRPIDIIRKRANENGFNLLSVNENLRKQKLKRCPTCREVFSIEICNAIYCNPCRAKREMSKRYKTPESYIYTIFSAVKHRTTKKNNSIDIDFDYCVDLYNKQNGKCFYTGIDMTFQRKESNVTVNFTNISIDRLDSSKSYTKDNVVLCCAIVNIMKNQLRIEEFKNWIKLIDKGLENVDERARVLSFPPM